MNKAEIWSLFERIVWYYPSFSGNEEKVEAWHDVLYDVPAETAIANLKRYARNESRYSPSPAALIDMPNRSSQYVPDAEATRAYLREMDLRAERVKEEQDAGTHHRGRNRRAQSPA